MVSGESMRKQSASHSSEDERKRLLALESYAVLDSSPDQGLNTIVRHARRIFGVPMAMVSFVANDRQIFKAREGLDACDLPREGSFCTHAIQGNDVLVVPDATLDRRFQDSPLVKHEPKIRFYAGAPLLGRDGFVIGALCIKDVVPRPEGLTFDQRQSLADLADLVMDKLELRRLAIAETNSRKRFDAVAGSAADAIICADGNNRILTWNHAAEAMFGYTAQEAIGQSLNIIVPARFRSMHEAGIQRIVAGLPTKLVGTLSSVQAQRRDGSEFPIEISLSHWTEGNDHRFGAIARDMTERVASESRLRHAAHYDALTGLANRTVLSEHLSVASENNHPLSLILIDLDGFKDVNDSLGHAAGDEVLQVVADRVRAHAGEQYLGCRLGGDEFVVILNGVAEHQSSMTLADSIVNSIEQPIEIGERSVYIGASAGISVMSDAAWSSQLPIEQADLALYTAKAEGKGRVRLFSQDMSQLAKSRISMSSGIRHAWEHQEFELFYQPQVRLSDGVVVGAEALIRWNHPERGLLAPGSFLSTLENSLLAVPASEWILRTACQQAARWQSMGFAEFRMGVNLFAAQFRAGDLSSVVETVLAQTSLPSTALELEITENIILRNELRINAMLAELREQGVGIAFDDYGTGFASLTMLKDFPVTRLKIDRSFVSGEDAGNQNRLIVEAISQLANGLNLDVIAEGIETSFQADLMRLYCREGQGYFFGRPMPASAFEGAFLQTFATNGREVA